MLVHVCLTNKCVYVWQSQRLEMLFMSICGNLHKHYYLSREACISHFHRKCLDLFPTPPPPEIRSELSLIASLALLDDFGIKMLPVQVRLCENKLDLIRSCLDSSSNAYKNVHEVSLVCVTVSISCVLHLSLSLSLSLSLTPHTLQILHLSKLLGLDTSMEESIPEKDHVSTVHLSRSKMSEGRGHSLIFIALTALQVSQ